MPDDEPYMQTRGVVITPDDVVKWDWPERAKAADLTTIALHPFPKGVSEFIATDKGQAFIERCRELELEVEYELHGMTDLLPRELFQQDATLFRMDHEGRRVADWNLCVHSKPSLQIVSENAVLYAKIIRPTTGRYFFWIDDGRPMCRCPKCRVLSDSDQALIVENTVLQALRQVDASASLAHLAYVNTLRPPCEVRPESGIFLEYAPILRRYDAPLSRGPARLDRAGAPTHGEHLAALDANLELFDRCTAQVLEYWLDVSRFSRMQDQQLAKLPWHSEVFMDDLNTYASRGIRHVTSFAVYMQGGYVQRFGEPPLNEYGQGLARARG